MDIAAETISLAHNEIHEDHIGQVFDLHNLLNSGLIEFTARVYAF